ncbi:hypothetical protein CRG98_020582 [Punica granatum]|uniref:Uncharacterized protein n=1 Tax=Punica granatum TaxID=22663 RepID=A0A2I0JRU1_PUNGR|nr:hypothetical protein CRG98_020582 [Punica granatum]
MEMDTASKASIRFRIRAKAGARIEIGDGDGRRRLDFAFGDWMTDLMDFYFCSGGGNKTQQEETQILLSIGPIRRSIDFGKPSPETVIIPPIPTDYAPVKSRSTTAKRRRCPEPSPASIPAVVAASRGENHRPQPCRRRSPRSQPPFG